MSGFEILMSDSRGVYIPQNFAESYHMDQWGVSDHDRDCLLSGPDYTENEFYWEAWENVVSNACYIDKNGNVWRLWQEGDLFSYCLELMTDEEYCNFFGIEREND